MSKQILQIAPTPFFADRGCHIRIEGIVRCLTELGYQNTVCTYHHGRDIAGVTTKRIKPIKNYNKTEAGPSKYKLWADWRLLWLSVRQYRAIKPVAIHAHLHEGLLIGIIIKVLFFWRGTPLVADMQGSLTGELDAHGSFDRLPFLRPPTRFLERLLMWAANYIVCSSQHSLQKIRDEFDVPIDKIALAQDGADRAPALTQMRRIELMQRYALPVDKKLIIYSGALLDSKGLQELKLLIKDCSKAYARLHFILIGYPLENIQPYLEKRGLDQIVTLTGQIPFQELSDYLSLADIAIDPKNTDAGEGSGKMLNYMACGLPVVAFDTANNREFLPKDTILAKSREELASHLLVLTNNDGLLEQAALQNLKRFEQNFSWQLTRDQLGAVYADLLD